VFNERPTAGGADDEYAQTAERDYIVLREGLREQAQAQAWQHLAALARDEFTVVAESMKVDIERETFAPGLRVATAEVTGRLSAQVTALAFSNAALNRLAEAAWAASLPAGFRPLGGAPEMTVPEYLGMDAGGPVYRVGVRGRIARVMDAGLLAERLRGATVAEARAALVAREGLGDPVDVEIWPGWAPRAFRLQVLQRRVD
jgi:hypothetical protein